MAKDAPAPASEPPDDGMGERDYAALLATLSASERGRAFLAEYSRRQRAAETELVLAAIARLEEMIAAQHAPATAERNPGPPALPVEPHLVRFTVVAPPPKPQPEPAEPARPAPAAAAPAAVSTASAAVSVAPAPASVSVAPPKPGSPTVVSIPEVSWSAEESPAQEEQPETATTDAPVETAIDEAASETALADELTEITATDETIAVTAAATVPLPDFPPAAEIALPHDEPAPPAMPSDILEQPARDEEERPIPSPAFEQAMPPSGDVVEQPAPPVSDTPVEPAPMGIALEQPLSAPGDALEQPAPPPAEKPQPTALPRSFVEQPAPSASHPLAQLMALTDEERIALFS